MPASTLSDVQAIAPPNIEARFVKQGGHAGFIAGRSPASPSYWAEEAVVRGLAAAL